MTPDDASLRWRVPRWITTTLSVFGFLLLLAALEAAHLATAGAGLRELQPLALAYGAAVLLAVAVGIGLVVGDVRAGLLLVAVAWACLCGASIVKRRYLGSPLYPWDLLRLREVVGIWDDLSTALRAAFVGGTLAVVAALGTAAWSLVRARWDRRALRRVGTGLVVLIAVVLPFRPAVRAWMPGPGNAVSVALGLRNVRWWPEKNYEVNGFTAGFLMSLDVLDVPRPPLAPPPLATDCVAPVPPPTVDAGATRTKPDVVVLLLESFFDPLTLGIPMSRDPIPFLRAMMHASGDAELHGTVWAHGTANAEFEILTGLSTAFLPTESVVFFHYLHAPVPSLATELRRVGYRAEAVHPNPGWFYARADAYPLLGFERAWFEHDFIARREAESRISDDRLFFAKLRERLTTTSDAPLFLWGVTLGTHGPYARKRMARCDLRVGGAASLGESLRIYACLLERLDRRMQEFVGWLQTRDRPTVLFAYGDHWPPLGPGIDTYHERLDASGARVAATTRDAGASLRFAATPLVVWSNAVVPLPLGYRGGFNFLAPAILRAAGVEPRCQFALLDPLHARVDTLHAGLMEPGVEPALAADVNRYWALTYGLLFDPTTAPAHEVPPLHATAAGEDAR